VLRSILGAAGIQAFLQRFCPIIHLAAFKSVANPYFDCHLQYECCTGHYPFDAQNEGALIRKIMRGQYPPITGPYSSALVQVGYN